MTVNVDSIRELRGIPEFVDFARRKMSADPERWQKEASNGVGFTQKMAIAIVEIAGGGQRDP